MSEALSPLAAWAAGAIYQAAIDGHMVTFAFARRGPTQIEGILRDGEFECRARADLLLDSAAASVDVITESLIEQWRAAQAPDVWQLMRGEEA